jgi:hypothetical protein
MYFFYNIADNLKFLYFFSISKLKPVSPKLHHKQQRSKRAINPQMKNATLTKILIMYLEDPEALNRKLVGTVRLQLQVGAALRTPLAQRRMKALIRMKIKQPDRYVAVVSAAKGSKSA